MALKPCCEVFDTSREVESYRLALSKYVEGATNEPIAAWAPDLCPRALKRLRAKIDSGVTPPQPRKKD